MHRLPLKLNEASYTWDRSLPDYVLFEKALNTENVKDMIKYLQQIDIEVNTCIESGKIAAINEYNDALAMLMRKDENSALILLENIILHAPKDGLTLALSLRVRAGIYYKHNRFESAAKDYEFLLHLTNYTLENILEVIGKLVVSFYMLGKFDKAKGAYEMYARHSTTKSSKKSTKAVKITPIETEIELLTFTVKRIHLEIEETHNTPKPVNREEEQISQFESVLCSDDTGDQQNGLYSKTDLPHNTVVVLEKPMVRTLTLPWVQCEQCLEISHHMYTCFDCRLKTYCCIECLKSDTHHVDECKGTIHLVVLMLNSQHLYKTFIEVIYLIKHHVLAHKGLTRLKTAGDVVTAIRTSAKDCNNPLLKLLAEECDYREMSDMEFSTVIATTIRLSVFIAERTNLIQQLRKKIKISNKQELIMVGCILMQLQYHLQKGSYIISFDVPFKRPKIMENTFKIEDQMKEYGSRISPKTGAKNANEYFYVNQDIVALKVSAYMAVEIEKTEKKPLPKEIKEPRASLSEDLVIPTLEYCDFVAKLVLQDEYRDNADGNGSQLSQYIARMDSSRRTTFLQSYFREYSRNLYNFFLRKKLNRPECPPKQIIILLGRDLRKFRHSCDPNVEIIFLTSGIVVGKTLKPVSKGEECFISFRSRYFFQNHETRKDILKRYNVQCDCQYCKMSDNTEPFAIHSNIICVPSCKTEFGFIEDVCPKCGRDYTTLLQDYATRIAELEAACCSDEEEREIHKNWIILDQVSEQIFPPYHEYRIMQRLKYAKFIAINNFAEQAYELTCKAYADIRKYYSEESILFIYYPTVLEILTLLQYYNVEQGLNNAPLSMLKEMNNLGFAIIQAQLTHVKIYEKFDQNCAAILTTYRQFSGWRARMHVMDIDLASIEKLLKVNNKIPGLESHAE